MSDCCNSGKGGVRSCCCWTGEEGDEAEARLAMVGSGLFRSALDDFLWLTTGERRRGLVIIIFMTGLPREVRRCCWAAGAGRAGSGAADDDSSSGRLGEKRPWTDICDLALETRNSLLFGVGSLGSLR